MLKKRDAKSSVSPEVLLETRYKSARIDLLVVIALTVVNLFMLLFGDGTYFLFSAAVPYNIAVNAMYLCGKLPPEYYQGDMFLPEFLGDEFFAVMLAIAFAILAVYALCFFMSRKRRVGWLIAALVLFVIDTVTMIMLYGIAPDMIIDMIIHGILIYYFAAGVHAAFKLKKIESQPAVTPPETDNGTDDVSHFFENDGFDGN